MKAKFLNGGAIIGAALAAILTTSASAQRSGDFDYGTNENNLTLVCWGEGKRPGTGVTTGYAWNHSKNKFTPQTYIHSTTKEFDSEVQVELHDDWGRIHLTGKLIPSINSGGNNGWWELENVHVGPDMITGRYRLNGLNKPRVEINRRSGKIKIDGIEKFRGDCDVGNWGERKNRF
jgi:hypothetical protein